MLQNRITWPAMGTQRFAFGDFLLDLDRGLLARDGSPVAIGNRALVLLGSLVGASNRTVTKSELLDAAWPGLAVEEGNLSVQIAALRKLLGPMPDGGDWIGTVARVGYRFAGTVSDAGRVAASQLSAPERPVVAVLEFASEGGGPDDRILAGGVTEDTAAALTRFRWFAVTRVVAVEAVGEATYLLRGNVRRSGERLRVSAQLIDARSGTHLWAEKYEPIEADLFGVQDEIAARVAGAIEPELLRTDATRAVKGASSSARDIIRRGTFRFHQVTRATHFEARELFREARRLDPRLAEAHMWLARVSAGIVFYEWTVDKAADCAEGFDAAVTAVRLDERSPYAHYGLAFLHICSGNIEQGVRAAEQSVDLNPSFALGHLCLGMAILFAGAAREATEHLERGLLLNPHDPQDFVWFNFLAVARLLSGDAERGLDAARRVTGIRADWRPGYETLACCQVALGEIEAARRTAAGFIRLETQPGDALWPMRQHNPDWTRRLNNLLETAGR